GRRPRSCGLASRSWRTPSGGCASAASPTRRFAGSSRRSLPGSRKLEHPVADAFVVEAADLQKRYEPVDALRGLNRRLPAGSIFGFLGRNGAGKTTTIKILLGMVRPTGGRAAAFGLAADDPASSVEIRRRTAFVSDEKDLYDSMRVDE